MNWRDVGLMAKKVGAGAFYFREFPRHDFYRVGVLPKNYVTLNHGFYFKKGFGRCWILRYCQL